MWGLKKSFMMTYLDVRGTYGNLVCIQMDYIPSKYISCSSHKLVKIKQLTLGSLQSPPWRPYII